MNDADRITRLEEELVEAHQQVLERDLLVHELTRQNAELRANFKVKAWKVARTIRRKCQTVLRRPT